MKTTLLSSLKSLIVTVSLLVTLPALAGKGPQVEALKKSLGAVPVLEIPAKAAQLVSEANAEGQESVALAVIVAVAQLKPAALAPVVGAVVRVAPGMAASIASAAVAQQPKQAGAITQAAVAAAPNQAGKIVRAVCKQAPKKYEEVALAAVQAAPSASREISEAVPQTASTQQVAAKTEVPLAGPPVVGPPFTTLSGTPTEIGRGNTVVVLPGGGRDYASP